MKSHLFKFAPLAIAAALAFAVSPLQASPHGGGGHGGGHFGGGHVGHVGVGHGFARGGSFRGGRTFAHGGRVFHGGYGYRGRGWGGPYWGLGLGYPYYGYYGYPYYDGGYAYDGDTSSVYSGSAVDNTAATVQQALAGAGYYHGAIDGIIGPASMAAISGYQRDHGLPVTGVINAALLRSLGIS